MILKSSYGYNIELTWRKLEEHLFTRVVRNEQLQHAPPMSNKLRYHFAILLAAYRIWVRGSRFNSARRSEGPISNKEHPKSELSVTPGQSKFLLQLLFYIVNIESLLDQFLLPCLAILGLCHYVVGTCWPFAGPSIDICFLRVQDKRVHLAPGAGCQMNRLILGPLRESWLYFFTLFCHVQPRCEKPYLEINSR